MYEFARTGSVGRQNWPAGARPRRRMLTGQLVWVRAWLCRKRLRKEPPPPPCRRSGGVPRSRLPGSKVPCAKPRSVPAGQLAGAGVCTQGTTSPSQRRSAAGSREIGRIIFYRTPGGCQWMPCCHACRFVEPVDPGAGWPRAPRRARGASSARGCLCDGRLRGSPPAHLHASLWFLCCPPTHQQAEHTHTP